MIIKSNVKVDEEAVKKFLETTDDWTATCPVCGVTVTGTLEQMRKHKCNVE